VLVAAAALAATDMVSRRWLADLVAVASAAAALTLSAILLARSADGLQVYWMGDWHPRGDRVALGISHPCTTFDKWRWMAVVDDQYRVVDAITTCF
jgi:D-serine deaminase-like pyridoxal phosphate-dependent protein